MVTCMARPTVQRFQQVPSTRTASAIDQHDSHSYYDSTNGLYHTTYAAITSRPRSYQITTTNSTKRGFDIEHNTDPAGYTSTQRDPWHQLSYTEATYSAQASASRLLYASCCSGDHHCQAQATTSHGHSTDDDRSRAPAYSEVTQAATTRATSTPCSTSTTSR